MQVAPLLVLLTAAGALEPPAAWPPAPDDTRVDAWRRPGVVAIELTGSQPGAVRLHRPDGQPSACADGPYRVEVVTLAAPGLPWLEDLCAALPHTPGLLPPGAEHVDTEIPGWADALRTGHLPAPAIARPPGVRVLPGAWPLRPLHLLVLAWAATLAWALRAQPLAWAMGALALAVRMGLHGPLLLLGRGHGVAKRVDGTGLDPNPSVYGDALAAMDGPWWWLSGGAPTAQAWTHLGYSALTVAALTAWLRQEGRLTAATAGLLAALMPLPVALAGTETEFVAVTLLQVTAVLGITRAGWAGAILGVASVGLLAHLRPVQALVAAALVLLAAMRGRGLLALAGGALVAARWAGPQGTGPDAALPWDQLHGTWSELLGVGGALLPLDPTRTPVVLTLLAFLALPLAPRRAVTWIASAAVVVGTAPYAWMRLPTDVLRTQLPAQTWLCALAALALVRVRLAGPVLGIPLLLASAWPARQPAWPRTAWQVEETHLQRVLPTLGPADVVRFDPTWDQLGELETWLNATGHGVWVPDDRRAPVAGELRWLGRGEGREGAVHPCVVDDLDVVELPAEGAGVEAYTTPTLRVGLVRTTTCTRTGRTLEPL
ncbi:MAG: hypothetical protein H6732_09545 [Alphaproteobacteria bacterium]|nr:hypothetical protein [Alphaproteobacteria bacterium]